jgi:hypothetical protein
MPGVPEDRKIRNNMICVDYCCDITLDPVIKPIPNFRSEIFINKGFFGQLTLDPPRIAHC